MLDLGNQRFGRWRVVSFERVHQTPNGTKVPIWLCRCDCGTVRAVRQPDLRHGKSRSCGCLQSEVASALGRVDLTGQRFGRLVALSIAGTKRTRLHWNCVCDCGIRVVVGSNQLLTGNTKSCGCYRRGMTSRLAKTVVTYSSAHHRLRRTLGSASGHPCVDCAGPAQDWSYAGGDPDELFETLGNSRIAYSLDPSRYVTRCKKCHKAFDLSRRALGMVS